LLLVGLLLASPLSASAQTSNWASVVSTRDLTGNVSLQPTEPLMAGHVYNATIKIVVPSTLSTSNFDVSLNKRLVSNGSQYWYLHTPQYLGYNRSTFTSSLKTVQFNTVQGQLVLSAIFKVPVNLTTVVTKGLTLHFQNSSFPLVTAKYTAPPQSQVGAVVVPVSDQSIQTYLTTYQSKSNLISSGLVGTSYSTLLNSILDLSQSMYKQGLTEQATALLNDFAPSTLPVPPNNSYVSYIVGAVILLAVLAVALALVYLRGRGKQGYSAGVMNEINRQLASLEIIAGRYDKTLADQLKSIREKLTEAS
jgi:hypothetical protein